MKKSSWTALKTALCIFFGIVFLGLGMALRPYTLCKTSTVVLLSLFPALVTGFLAQPIVRLLTRSQSGLLNILTGASLSFTLFFGAFYGINYWGASSEVAEVMEGTVERKFTRERYRTRRLSRNRVVRTGKYNVFCYELRLPDGDTREYEIPVERYNRLRKGGTIPVERYQGALGVSVIKPIYKEKGVEKFGD